MSEKETTYWKSFLGIPLYKVDWYAKKFLYTVFGFTFDKLQDQKDYWNTRGKEYFQEMIESGHINYELFFQDMLIENLRELDFDSFFESGCGFGWNVKRVKQEFPDVRIGGVDFSLPQLENSYQHVPEIVMPGIQGDACEMPLKDNAYDIGFTLGVYMNIHADNIGKAIDELIRVSKKYIIHLEWDQENTKPALRDKRVFKTNIVSHDYKKLYEERGKKVIKFETYRDFEDKFSQAFKPSEIGTWEQFEGPEKYILIVVEM